MWCAYYQEGMFVCRHLCEDLIVLLRIIKEDNGEHRWHVKHAPEEELE